MAFNSAVAEWIPNWSEDATNITVPIATFPEMTAAEADAATGDIRKVLFAMMEQLSAKWYATAAADRPAQMVISKSPSTDPATGITTNVYTLRFYCGIVSQEVNAEA